MWQDTPYQSTTGAVSARRVRALHTQPTPDASEVFERLRARPYRSGYRHEWAEVDPALYRIDWTDLDPSDEEEEEEDKGELGAEDATPEGQTHQDKEGDLVKDGHDGGDAEAETEVDGGDTDNGDIDTEHGDEGGYEEEDGGEEEEETEEEVIETEHKEYAGKMYLVDKQIYTDESTGEQYKRIWSAHGEELGKWIGDKPDVHVERGDSETETEVIATEEKEFAGETYLVGLDVHTDPTTGEEYKQIWSASGEELGKWIYGQPYFDDDDEQNEEGYYEEGEGEGEEWGEGEGEGEGEEEGEGEGEGEGEYEYVGESETEYEEGDEVMGGRDGW